MTARFSTLTGLALLGAGCSFTPPLNERFQPWIGRTGEELRTAYVAEPAVYRPDERTEMLSWEEQALRPDPGSLAVEQLGVRTRTSSEQRCTVTFTVVDGIVNAWTWRGDNSWMCPVRVPPEIAQEIDP